MAAEEIGFRLVLPILAGILVGILEVYFLQKDEGMSSTTQFFQDAWHAWIVCVAGTVIACNAPWVISWSIFPEFLRNWLFMTEYAESMISILVCILIMLIVKIKMVVHKAGLKGKGFQETFLHSFTVAALVGFSPFYVFPIYLTPLGLTLIERLPSFIPL